VLEIQYQHVKSNNSDGQIPTSSVTNAESHTLTTFGRNKSKIVNWCFGLNESHRTNEFAWMGVIVQAYSFEHTSHQ